MISDLYYLLLDKLTGLHVPCVCMVDPLGMIVNSAICKKFKFIFKFLTIHY